MQLVEWNDRGIQVTEENRCLNINLMCWDVFSYSVSFDEVIFICHRQYFVQIYPHFDAVGEEMGWERHGAGSKEAPITYSKSQIQWLYPPFPGPPHSSLPPLLTKPPLTLFKISTVLRCQCGWFPGLLNINNYLKISTKTIIVIGAPTVLIMMMMTMMMINTTTTTDDDDDNDYDDNNSNGWWLWHWTERCNIQDIFTTYSLAQTVSSRRAHIAEVLCKSKSYTSG